MYFNVYSDTGSEIHGYLIPDGFSTSPRIVVRLQNEVLGPFACDVFLEGPYQHKHHATGIVGFVLTSEAVPGIHGALNIEIADADSGFVFYRRFDPDHHIEKRFFRLETQFAPHRELDRSLKPHFQFFADGVEQLGSETVRQTLEVANQPSTYVSGRVMYRSVQQYLTQETISITSIRDPFYELAIRLWTVASFKRRGFSFVSDRDSILFEPAMTYFSPTDFSNENAIRRMIRDAPKDILALFESPFVHQLVASSPTDKVGRDGVSTALDTLSQFTVFIPNETDDSLAVDLAELLAIDRSSVVFSPMRSPFLELSDVLRSVKTLEQVLENDLILFHFVKRAEERAQRSGS